jgi:regulatory protein
VTKSQQLPNRTSHLRLVTPEDVPENLNSVQVEEPRLVVPQQPEQSSEESVVLPAAKGRSKKADISQYSEDEVYELAKKFVLRKLTGSGQTRYQIEKYLKLKEIPQSTIDLVLDRFAELGLLDDQEFADTWVRNRRSTRKSGPSVLRRELQERGVDSQSIATAIEAREGEDYDFARELAIKRLPSLMRYDPEARIRRLANFLIRRGYAPGLAFNVVKDLIAEAEVVLEDPDFS